MIEEKKEAIDNALRKQLLDSISMSHLINYLKLFFQRRYRSVCHKEWYDIENRCFFWINGQYAYGLLCNHSSDDITVLKRFYNKVLILFNLKLLVFDRPDSLIHAYVLLVLYNQYGQKKYKRLIDSARDYIIKEAEESGGLIRYRRPYKHFFIDTLGMMNAFCYEYGKVFHDSDIILIANKQIDYIKEKCNESNELFPYHVYDMSTGESKGSNSWGRGIGWFLLGLTECAINNLQLYSGWYIELLDHILSSQNNEGFFYDDLIKKNHIDTSITSMVALSLAKGLNEGLFGFEKKERLNSLTLSINALLKSTNEYGQVLNSSGECHGVGEYSLEYGNFFSQGYTLATLNLLTNDIVESLSNKSLLSFDW